MWAWELGDADNLTDKVDGLGQGSGIVPACCFMTHNCLGSALLSTHHRGAPQLTSGLCLSYPGTTSAPEQRF